MKCVNLSCSNLSIRERIIRDLFDVVADGLQSISLVGSSIYRDDLTMISDIDIVLIFRELTSLGAYDVFTHMNRIADTNSEPELKIVTEYRNGPVKPSLPPQGTRIVQLHLLLYDTRTWINAANTPGCRLWLFDNLHIKGTRIITFAHPQLLSIEMIRRHLCIMRESLGTRRVRCKGHYIDEKGELSYMNEELALSPFNYAQLIGSYPTHIEKTLMHFLPKLDIDNIINRGDWEKIKQLKKLLENGYVESIEKLICCANGISDDISKILSCLVSGDVNTH